MTTTTTPMMAIRMTWTAAEPRFVRTALSNLEDMLRGCVLSALRPPAWAVSYVTFHGASEAKLNPNSCRYGVTLWVHPSAE